MLAQLSVTVLKAAEITGGIECYNGYTQQQQWNKRMEMHQRHKQTQQPFKRHKSWLRSQNPFNEMKLSCFAHYDTVSQ